MNAPDVSVVVAVYNTMPDLTRCLTSLVEQSIGRERLEIVAVDDGSTDGSGKELDRFARLYPDTVKVIHQANSGGPAVPSNRALERATGRYVFFIGADDYLGREALERLVAAADDYGSDVVLGRMVGVNGRHIDQTVFARNEVDISLFDSALPWSLANTKLFRRDLIERHHLRYPEDMPVGSDQPFTIEACARARRISVLADYDFYYAVRRLNARNITYQKRHEERLRCAEAIMTFVAGLIEPGPRRDAVLRRHFTWEVGRLLDDDFLRLDTATQDSVQIGVRKLADLYLTDNLRQRLPVETRLRLSVAQHGSLDSLLAIIRQDAEQGVPSAVVDGDRWYAAYPGFRDGSLSFPDSWFDITDTIADWLARFEATSVRWEAGAAGGDTCLSVTARSPRRDLSARCAGPVRIAAGSDWGTLVETAQTETGTLVRVRFTVEQLLTGIAPGGELRVLRTQVRLADATGEAPLRASRVAVPRLIRRRGHRLYLITPVRNHKGQLAIAVAPVTPRRVIARMRRGWLRGGR